MKAANWFRVAAILLVAFALILVGSLIPAAANTQPQLTAGSEPNVNGEVFMDTTASPSTPAEALSGPVRYKFVSGNEFLPFDSTLTYHFFGSGIYAIANPGNYPFRAPIDLPHGAQVTRIDYYVIDNSDSASLTAGYTYAEPATTPLVFVFEITTEGLTTNSSIKTLSQVGAPLFTVDTSRRVYGLSYQPSAAGMTLMMVGARIEYTFPTSYLPVINR